MVTLFILPNLAVRKRQGSRFSNKEGAGSLGTLGKCDQQVSHFKLLGYRVTAAIHCIPE
jgi:hypothetical protein